MNMDDTISFFCLSNVAIIKQLRRQRFIICISAILLIIIKMDEWTNDDDDKQSFHKQTHQNQSYLSFSQYSMYCLMNFQLTMKKRYSGVVYFLLHALWFGRQSEKQLHSLLTFKNFCCWIFTSFVVILPIKNSLLKIRPISKNKSSSTRYLWAVQVMRKSLTRLRVSYSRKVFQTCI